LGCVWRMLFRNEHNTRLLTNTKIFADAWPLIYSLIMSNPVISLNDVIPNEVLRGSSKPKALAVRVRPRFILVLSVRLFPLWRFLPFCLDQDLRLICNSVSLLFIQLSIWHHTWRLSSSLKAQVSPSPHRQQWSSRMGLPCTVLQPPTSLMTSNGGRSLRGLR
jgi:hypothetical protein